MQFEIWPPIKDFMRPLYQSLRYYYHRIRYYRYMPNILNIEDTLSGILNNHVSISRFGDGELNIMNGGSIGFCDQNTLLATRLIEVMTTPIPNHYVCLPPMLNSLDRLTSKPKHYWKNLLAVEYPLWFKFIHNSRIYGNAFVSRFFMDYQDSEFAKVIVAFWKRIWNNRDCLIVEGCNTRMGMGNDLLDNAKSIRRILCPPKDAYIRYDEIFASVKNFYNEEEKSLVLIALGPVATVLAYDFCKDGIQAIDIGHLDIEYEWFLRKSKNKINIPTKAVNEYKSGGLDVTNDVTDAYKNQIVSIID